MPTARRRGAAVFDARHSDRGESSMLSILTSASASTRLSAARQFVLNASSSTETLVVSASRGAADDFARDLARARGATFGLYRFSLTQLAARLAAPLLARDRCRADHRAWRAGGRGASAVRRDRRRQPDVFRAGRVHARISARPRAHARGTGARRRVGCDAPSAHAGWPRSRRSLRTVRGAVRVGVRRRSRRVSPNRDARGCRRCERADAVPAAAARRRRDERCGTGAHCGAGERGARGPGDDPRGRRADRCGVRQSSWGPPSGGPGPAKAGPHVRREIRRPRSRSPVSLRPRRSAARAIPSTRSNCSPRLAKAAKPSRSRGGFCAKRAAACRSIAWRSCCGRRSSTSGCWNTRSNAPACRRISNAAPGARIPPDARSSRCWRARSTTSRRAGLPNTSRSDRCRMRPCRHPSASAPTSERRSLRRARRSRRRAHDERTEWRRERTERQPERTQARVERTRSPPNDERHRAFRSPWKWERLLAESRVVASGDRWERRLERAGPRVRAAAARARAHRAGFAADRSLAAQDRRRPSARGVRAADHAGAGRVAGAGDVGRVARSLRARWRLACCGGPIACCASSPICARWARSVRSRWTKRRACWPIGWPASRPIRRRGATAASSSPVPRSCAGASFDVVFIPALAERHVSAEAARGSAAARRGARALWTPVCCCSPSAPRSRSCSCGWRSARRNRGSTSRFRRWRSVRAARACRRCTRSKSGAR